MPLGVVLPVGPFVADSSTEFRKSELVAVSFRAWIANRFVPVWRRLMELLMSKAEGFRAAGASDLAARIKSDTAALISGAGFHEYFDPQTGAGLGGGHFSWTASVALSWPLLTAASGA